MKKETAKEKTKERGKKKRWEGQKGQPENSIKKGVGDGKKGIKEG